MEDILITGHQGLLGSALTRRFLKNPRYRVLTTPKNLISLETTQGVFQDLKPTCVIHCAAKVGGVKANRNYPVNFLLENLRLQNNVIQCSHEWGVRRLVFIGTSCLFPREVEMPVREESLLTGRFEPDVEAYAIAKLAGWRLCKAYYEQYGHMYVTACPSNLYGPNDNYASESAHVIPALMAKLKHSLEADIPFQVWGAGDQVREFLHSDDAASAIEIVLDRWTSPEVINIGSGKGTTIFELVKTLIEIAGKKPEHVVWDCGQPTGIPRKTFDISKLRALGWEPKITLREGLESTWKEFCENPKPRGL
jgi:GDP-L-fucose synthase